MKKIYKMSGWNTDAFTEDNVLNRTHWLVKALYDVIELMNIGSFSLSYKDANSVTFASVNYGLFNIYHPTYANSTPYIFYIDTDNKELFGCCSAETVKDYTSTVLQTNNECNGLRGRFRGSTGVTYARVCGGYLALKFDDGRVIGSSNADAVMAGASGFPVDTFNLTGIVLPYNKEIIAAPIDAVEIQYTRLPIYEDFMGQASTTPAEYPENSFEGRFFRNINAAHPAYLGALKSSDNIKIAYGGYLFIVDDANDIGLITV